MKKAVMLTAEIRIDTLSSLYSTQDIKDALRKLADNILVVQPDELRERGFLPLEATMEGAGWILTCNITERTQ